MVSLYKCFLYIFFLSVAGSFVACSFSKRASRELLQEAKNKGPFDVVVVPGVPLENGQWNRTMKGRIYWSKYLFDQGIAKNIMYSGAAVYTPYYEAEVMAMYAVAIGIPAEHIYTEIKAEHSTENIYYGYKKAIQAGFKTIALASDPFQSKLLRRYTRKKVSRDIVIIPMVVDTMEVLEGSMINPDIAYGKAFKKDFISIKKRESFWKRLRGTIRGNADTTAYSAKEQNPSGINYR